MSKLYLVVKNTGKSAFIWGLFKDPKNTKDLDPLAYRVLELQSDLVEDPPEQVREPDLQTTEEK